MKTHMEAVLVLEAHPRDLCPPQIRPEAPPRPNHILPINIFQPRGQAAEAVGTAVRNVHGPNPLDLLVLK